MWECGNVGCGMWGCGGATAGNSCSRFPPEPRTPPPPQVMMFAARVHKHLTVEADRRGEILLAACVRGDRGGASDLQSPAPSERRQVAWREHRA